MTPGAAARLCPVCAAPIARARLMCPAHWRAVPQPLQAQVWRSWSRWRNPHETAHAMQRLAEYRRAADAAVEYVISLSPKAATTTDPQRSL